METSLRSAGEIEDPDESAEELGSEIFDGQEKRRTFQEIPDTDGSLAEGNSTTPQKPAERAPPPPEVEPPLYVLPTLEQDQHSSKKRSNTPAGFSGEIPLKSPQEVLKKVAEAAEHNEPIELGYERRQEVKDKPTETSVNPGAVPVGKVILDRVASSAPQASSPAAQSVTDTASSYGHPLARRLNIAPLYIQALKRGFWGGVMVLVLILIISLLY